VTDRLLDSLLGSRDPDPGCEGAFELLDQYAEAVRRGANPSLHYPEIVAHLHNCAACREDAEGLLAALELLEPPATGQ
jgi:hypothetical protein